jgi:hypothetical protein
MDNGSGMSGDDERQGHPSGFVYILSNQAFEGLLKIGETSISPYQRAKELQGTGVPRPFIVERAFYVKERQNSERLVHEALNVHRLEDNREFFETSIENAISVAETILRKSDQLDNNIWPNTDREDKLDEEVKFLRERLRSTETALEATRESMEQIKTQLEQSEASKKVVIKSQNSISVRHHAAVKRESERAERAEAVVQQKVGYETYKELEDMKKSRFLEFKEKYS